MEGLSEAINLFGLNDLQPYLSQVQPWVKWGQQHLWTIVGLVAGGWIFLLIVVATRTPKPTAEHGKATAHFATKHEIKRKGLDAAQGVYVGRAYGMPLRVPRSHFTVIGPSECGKTKSFVAGLIAEFDGSVMTLDLKGEHIKLTADLRRARNNEVHIFEPRSRASGHINLLDFVPFGVEEEVKAVQRVSDHLTTLDGTTATQGALFYRDSNREILEAVMLYQGNFDKPASFGRLRWKMGNMTEMLDAMSRVDYHLVKSVADDLKELPMRERRALWRSARQLLRVYDDPILAANTDDTTIDLSTLQFSEQPQTVYIRVTPGDAQGPLRNTIRLLIDQHVTMAGEREDITKFRHHEEIALDDQNEIGYFAAPDHIRAFYREHGLWVTGIFQSLEQVCSYGKDESMLENSKTWVVFRPQHYKSSKFVSEKLGTTTTYERRITKTRGRPENETMIPHEAKLMGTFEVENIPDYHAFVFRGGVPPIMAEQVMFTERRLLGAAS